MNKQRVIKMRKKNLRTFKTTNDNDKEHSQPKTKKDETPSLEQLTISELQ